MVAVHRSEWNGDVKMLLIAIDIGTTFTAASFSILEPGSVPMFQEVVRWPKQSIADAKVPSVVYYDQRSRAKAFGAETADDEIVFNAEEQLWQKAEWWKLHLRPAHLTVATASAIPPLPAGTSVDIIFTDFLRYVKEQVQEYITISHGNGDRIWSVLHRNMTVVLTTPNGWEGAQQQRMRSAATKAGLVNAQGTQHIRFVSEAEAAILFAIDSGCITDWMETNEHLTLCDCGGGTIDISSYRMVQIKPLVLQETSVPRCTLTGAVFVTNAFRTFLKGKPIPNFIHLALTLELGHVHDTEWDNDEVISRAVTHFEHNAKRKFEDPSSSAWVDLGGFKSMPNLGIVRGKLKIPGDTIATFFVASIESIKKGLLATYEQSDRKAKRVILVGGLASSPYVCQQLVLWGQTHGLSLSRPDGPMSKAVANGALSWYLQNPVSARMSKHHYGIEVSAVYDSSVVDMVGRATYQNTRGELRVESAWNCIVAKDAVVRTGQDFHQSYSISWGETQLNFVHTSDILIYRGDEPPCFVSDSDSSKLRAGFQVACSVSADLRAAFEAARPRMGSQGQTFRDVSFDICIDFGETELTAKIRWMNHGQYVHGPATISYLPLAPDVVDHPPPYATLGV